ncbi:uncharacterized protein topaz1 isoform X2 [Austrofundulus limnaeus]|uniref:Protein TOPAZ1 n=1 Tax=Austrofundulus limnaeus TaxID=52670 RepID=A0A2I4C9B8_AUSLI|nr:PREDICTED: testis- and ovary-specific PAZ domain-containing protein 1 isoform X2 [Austrofundulus limnaeus]
MVSMLPSSSRVKLNRVALKDFMGVKLVPQRRPPKPEIKGAAESTKQEKNLVSEFLSKEDAAMGSDDSNEPFKTLLIHQKEAENGKDAVCDGLLVGGRLEQKATRSELHFSTGDEMQRKQSGPTTRDINRNVDPNSNGLDASGDFSRSSVEGCTCVICGSNNYTSPQKKNLGKQRPKSSNTGFNPPAAELNVTRETRILETPKEINANEDLPKVMLCDVAKKCDPRCHKCGYRLPDTLKSKVVHCFKQDMKAGLQIWSRCSGHNKLKNQKRRSNVLNNESISQTVTGHQKHPKVTDSEASQPSGPAELFHGGWTEEDSETSSAAVGDHQTDNRTNMFVEEDTLHRDKRIKLGDSVGSTSTAGSALEENCSITNSCDPEGELVEAETSSDASSENHETGDPESFTCQRVKPYVRKILCARTYMPWPFLKPACSAQGFTTASTSGPVCSSATEKSATNNQNQASTKQGITLQDPSSEEQNDNGNSFNNWSSYSYKANTDVSTRSETFLPSPQLDSVLCPISGLPKNAPAVDPVPTSPFPINSTEIDTCTPSPSALGLSDWETTETFSPLSDVSTHSASSSTSGIPRSLPPSIGPLEKVRELQTVDKLLLCKDTKLTATTSLSPMSSSNSSHSYISPSLLHQYELRKEVCYTDRSPPKLKPYFTRPVKDACSVLCGLNNDHCVEVGSCEFRLPPVLSPITSPQWRRSLSCQSSTASEDEEVFDTDANRAAKSPEPHVVQMVNSSNENTEDFLQRIPEEMEVISSSFRALTDETKGKPQSSSNDDKNVSEQKEEGSLHYSDHEDKIEEGSKSSEQCSPEPKMKTTHGSGVQTEPCSSLSSNEEDCESFRDEEEQHSAGEEGCFSKQTFREIQGTEPDGDCQLNVLDELTAYEQDILLVEVTQDDPELFQNLPKQSLLKLGPVRRAVDPIINTFKKVTFSPRIDGSSSELEQKITPVLRHFADVSPDISEESESRPWRPRSSTTLTKIQNTFPAAYKQTRHVDHSDANNSQVDGGLERAHPILNMNSHISPQTSSASGLWLSNSAKVADGHQKINSYCRLYFSESHLCDYKTCRFHHLPLKGHEKFCIEQVTKFTKIPVCLKKAGDIFTGYYQSSPPGMYFSVQIFLSLLWALLRAGMVLEVFSVLSVSVAHGKVPDHEFLLALFDFVRDKNLKGFLPKLMDLTKKMAKAGLELNVDCLEGVKNFPLFQHNVHPNSSVSVSGSHSTQIPKYLNLTHALVEIGLCTKQEDWKRMGEVFRTLCHFTLHPNQVERLSGCVAIGLLSESKVKGSLPFAVFAEIACQNEGEDSLLKAFVGRIGVSLMLRYHKTHQWTNGRRVVEVMSSSKVNYGTLKGLFGNEDRASRCYLVTVATELFLLSSSVEGALNTLRENDWFLSSSSWPCEPADLESRTRLLTCLAEKTSHRDTLEVLCHLPGVKEPNDLIDISRYSPQFNSHLQVCMEKQILPVAADTVNFMLCKKLPVDHSVLQTLIHKLGKQNFWLLARRLFKLSQNLGYYPEISAPPGFMSLTVPCRLGEVELVLAFEKFITVNASVILPLPETSTTSLSITLKRTQSCESEYISAGSRVLSAARIPRPKLTVHYTTVNSSQEQVFTLDVSSARRWLQHNHLWANEIWTL